MLRVFIILAMLALSQFASSAKIQQQDPADLIINALCNDFEGLYPQADSCYLCTQKLANMLLLLHRAKENQANTYIPSRVTRLLIKRPSAPQTLEEDEMKRNSIDALHGLTLG